MNPLKFRMHDLMRRAAALDTDIESLFAYDAAVGFAFKERTGHDLRPGEAFTHEDAERAEEIVRLFPK